MARLTPTIRDVAALAQVSVATVSRVLNDNGYADPDTRARVLAAAAQLDYQRNINWSRLKRQSSRTILFVLGNRRQFNTMHMRLLEACERTLGSRGYDLIFTRHDYASAARGPDLPLPRLLEQAGAVDGVLLAGVHHLNLVQALEKRRLPYALLGNDLEGSSALAARNCIFYDDQSAIGEAVAYLARLGHRRIAFTGNTALPWFERRHQGYLRAVGQQGFEAVEVTEDWQIDNLDYGQLATAQLLRMPHPPTAILAANDELAAGAWKELVKRGVPIPQEMSLIGVGDRAEFAILEPPLTSISVFVDQLGERLTSMLLRRIEDPKLQAVSEHYPCKLVERGSCGPRREVKPMARRAWS